MPFTRAQRESDSITLRIVGMDDYELLSLFILGADRAADVFRAGGKLAWSDDPTNGIGSVTLPLAALLTEVPPVIASFTGAMT